MEIDGDFHVLGTNKLQAATNSLANRAFRMMRSSPEIPCFRSIRFLPVDGTDNPTVGGHPTSISVGASREKVH
jgi:hypothetical protein